MGGHSCPILGSYIEKGYTMIKEWKDLPTAKQYSVGDYVLVKLSDAESYVVMVTSVHDGHYDVIEYSAEEMVGELYMDDDNHRLIGR
jgi:hypothetical protein